MPLPAVFTLMSRGRSRRYGRLGRGNRIRGNVSRGCSPRMYCARLNRWGVMKNYKAEERDMLLEWVREVQAAGQDPHQLHLQGPQHRAASRPPALEREGTSALFRSRATRPAGPWRDYQEPWGGRSLEDA
ncbi:hypothetical protein VTK73DRAFT_8471 [Phialemonium thermophilum]|uniref:Uncharacterized protein n=1 Tax=Phialemonium thermophilum TaxID=223376 RepID=A0ABR3W904_9PEZI